MAFQYIGPYSPQYYGVKPAPAPGGMPAVPGVAQAGGGVNLFNQPSASYLQNSPATSLSVGNSTQAGGVLQPAATAQQVHPQPTNVQQMGTTNPGVSPQTFSFMNGTTFNGQGQQVNTPPPAPAQQPGGYSAYSGTPAVPTSYGGNSAYPGNPDMSAASSQAYPALPAVDTTNQDKLAADVQAQMQMSPAEIADAQALKDLQDSYRQGNQRIADKVIPMEFITGQQQSLENRYNNSVLPLQQQAALDQAKRQASLDASKYALSREDTKVAYERQLTAPQTIQPGSTIGRFNPATGTFDSLYQSNPVPQYSAVQNPLSPNGVTIYDQRTGQPSGSGGATFGNPAATSGGNFPSGAQTPGSAAAVNDPLGIKPNGQFSQFQTPDQGFQAGVQLVQKYQSGGPAGMNANSSLNQMINTWITGNPNNTAKTGYTANDVASYLQQMGVQANANTPIGQIDPTKLAAAIAHFETGYTPGQGGGTQQQGVPNYTGNAMIDSWVSQVISGKAAPSQVPNNLQSVVNTTAAQVTNGAYNPSQAEINYQNQQTAQKNSVPLLQSAKTVTDHLSKLATDAAAAKLSNTPVENDAALWYYHTLNQNNPGLTNWLTDVGIVRDELAKVLVGTGSSTDDARKQASELLPDNLAASQVPGKIAAISQLMNDKVKEYSNPNTIPSIGGAQPPATQSGTGNLTMDQLKAAYNINY